MISGPSMSWRISSVFLRTDSPISPELDVLNFRISFGMLMTIGFLLSDSVWDEGAAQAPSASVEWFQRLIQRK